MVDADFENRPKDIKKLTIFNLDIKKEIVSNNDDNDNDDFVNEGLDNAEKKDGDDFEIVDDEKKKKNTWPTGICW